MTDMGIKEQYPYYLGNQPELETLDYRSEFPKNQVKTGFLGLNAHVIKPESRVNKAEDAGQTLEQPKPTIAELEEILKRNGGGSIEIMPNGEIRTKEAFCSECGNPKRKDRKGLPIQYCGKPCPLPKAEQPNQNLKIIEEIEGLISQVNDKLDALVITDKEPGDSARKWRKNMALEEIDLFQKTTLFELRKNFE